MCNVGRKNLIGKASLLMAITYLDFASAQYSPPRAVKEVPIHLTICVWTGLLWKASGSDLAIFASSYFLSTRVNNTTNTNAHSSKQVC